ncbi:peptidyl-prolyl cis-trans isomerase [Dysgonomonas sp.]
MKRIINIGVILVFISVVSCKKENVDTDMSKTPVVTVNNETLYKAELDDAVPRNLSAEDSTEAAQSYIKMWINTKLVYNKAKQNIVNKEEIDQLVEDYRKSLIINSFQEQLIREHFSKAVKDKELEAYYEKNKDKIKLKENIVKGLFLKVPVDSKELANFQKWYKQTNDAAVENIEKKRLQNAVGYEYFYNDWVSFSSMSENIPLSIDNEEQFLKTNKNIEVRDSSFVYLLNIKEYKLIGSEAPFDYVKNHLMEIYIEQQRSDYLKQVQDDLYKKAVSDGEIKFYDNKL